jgi:hypothetical protein
MAPRRLSRLLYRPAETSTAPDPAVVGRFTEQVWFEYQAGRIGRVVAALPELIRTAQLLEDEPGDDRAGWAVSARVHHLAATTLSKVGESDLSWIAAERALHAAEQADDPLVLASAARAGTHAFLANGRYDDALSLGSTAAGWLRERMDEDDPEALSLFGMLHLRTAVAAGRHQDRGTARELLDLATDAAERLGTDANHWQTGFGPTNVELHRLSVALDLGDVTYVIERAPRITTENLPAERTATHLIDTGRALSLVAVRGGRRGGRPRGRRRPGGGAALRRGGAARDRRPQGRRCREAHRGRRGAWPLGRHGGGHPGPRRTSPQGGRDPRPRPRARARPDERRGLARGRPRGPPGRRHAPDDHGGRRRAR